MLSDCRRHRLRPGGISGSSNNATGPRSTGFSSLPFVEWGANIGIFFESKVDSLAAIIAYFKAGLAGNEKCLWEISDPFSECEVRDALSVGIPRYEEHIQAGDLAIETGVSWNLGSDEANLQRITGRWPGLLLDALNAGYAGLRIGGNATWSPTQSWKDICRYGEELGLSIAGQKIVLLCAASDLYGAFDEAARARPAMVYPGGQSGIAMHALRRNADDTPASISGGHSGSFEKTKFVLTARERQVLALVVNGISSKEGARSLGVSRRTIEFHRSNIMSKLGVRNVVELVQAVLRNGDSIGRAIVKSGQHPIGR